jgi:hypothetical protein
MIRQHWIARAAYEELHLRNLLVNLFHELDNEVDKLVLKHLLGVEVCDEEGDVVSLLSCDVSTRDCVRYEVNGP